MSKVINSVLAYMESHIGDKYSQTKRWEKGYYDCSSLVYRAFKAAGVTITHKDTGKAVTTSCYEVYAKGFKLLYPDSYSKIGNTLPTAKSLLPKLNLEPGDQIFYNFDRDTHRSNKITHVSIVRKGGGIIHARNPKKGVCTDPLTYGNTRVCAVVRYIEAEKSGKSATIISRVLKKKIVTMKGDDVKAVQAKLISLGYNLGKWRDDGKYGPCTRKAVIAYQKDNGLEVDGKVGPNTTAALGFIWAG